MNSLLPRGVRVALLLIAAGQGVLIIVQADLLARAIAGLDVAVLPWLGGVVFGRAALTWLGGGVSRRSAASAKAGLRVRLLARAGGVESGGRFDAVLANVLASRAGRTTVVVTHRLSCLDRFKEVIELDRGRIVRRYPTLAMASSTVP